MKDTNEVNKSLPMQGDLEGLNKSLPTQGGLEGLFFELLQVAIGNRKELTRQLSDDEWASLYSECEKHALLGITFCGVERLPKEQFPPFDVAAEWVHDAQMAKERNEKLNAECEALAKQLEHDGLWSCILKGQSNLVNYPEHLRDCRTAGDIDVWCAPIKKQDKGERKVIEYALSRAKAANQPVPEVRYHHVELENVYPVDVEIHHRPSFMCSPLRNIRLRNWCRTFEGANEIASINGHEFPVPSVSFNAVYQLVHIYRHLFDEGIGLRQILDYYFVLQALSVPLHRGKCEEVRDERLEVGRPPQSPCVGGEVRAQSGEVIDERLEVRRPPQSPCVGGEVSVEGLEVSGERIGSLSTGEGGGRGRVMNIIERLGMKKFAGAIMYVLQKVFAMPDEYLICKPNEKVGAFVLSEILVGGNFGRADSRFAKAKDGVLAHAFGKTLHNLMFLRYFPEEVSWEPIFRLYHWGWRKCEFWKV